MERRSFLKLCAAAPLVAAAPQLVFADIDEKLKAGVRHIGNVRETITADVRTGQYIVNYDVLCGTKHKDSIVLDKMYGTGIRIADLDDLPDKKAEILRVLARDMKKEGVDFTTITSSNFKLGDTIQIRKPVKHKTG